MLMTEAIERIAENCLGAATRRAARAITNFHNSLLRPLELSSSQFVLLTEIARAPDQSLAAIAACLTLDESTLNRNLAVLERRGLLRKEGGFGRIGKRAILTADGRELVERAAPVWSWANDEIAAVLSPEELESGRRFLEAIERAADAARTRDEELSPEDRQAHRMALKACTGLAVSRPDAA